jgi:TonB family protein
MSGRSIWIVLAAAICLPSLALAQQSTLPSPDDPSFVQGAPYGPEQIPRMKMAGDGTVQNIIHKVPPEYPADALAAKIGGTVVFAALVATDGSVKQVQVVSGPVKLIDAATKAVKQWKYAPWTFNGKPADVETTISVIFNPEDPTGAGIIYPQLKADILHMYYAMVGFEGAETRFDEEFSRAKREVVAAIPSSNENREEILEAYNRGYFTTIRLPAFTDGIVAIYAKHFTDDEIKAIDQFFQTPAGRHFALESVQVNFESKALGRKFATDHIPGVLAELCKEFPELQRDASLCRSSSSSSDSDDSQLTMPLRPDVLSPNPTTASDQ